MRAKHDRKRGAHRVTSRVVPASGNYRRWLMLIDADIHRISEGKDGSNQPSPEQQTTT